MKNAELAVALLRVIEARKRSLTCFTLLRCVYDDLFDTEMAVTVDRDRVRWIAGVCDACDEMLEAEP